MYEDLLTQGYVVIPGYLNHSQLELLRSDHARDSEFNNLNYRTTAVSRSVFDQLRPMLMLTLHTVQDSTGLCVDTPMPSGQYTDTAQISFGWHQDHEAFYQLQQNREYLNFYIPFVKPDPSLSGLSVIPFTALAAADPSCMHRVVNHGAAVYTSGTVTTVRDDDLGMDYQISCDIDSLAVHPRLSPGDLLLMRGDLIHRTQDNLTQRVAVSIRCTNGSALISRTRLLQGCDKKLEIMDNNRRVYNHLLQKFADLGSDQLLAAVMFDLADTVAVN
jgi:Phytanoyl-CoA dioxygenase (PhyH)